MIGFGPRRRAVVPPLPTRERPVMRALEPRVLLDAAGFETAVDGLNDAVHAGLADDWFARRDATASADTDTVPDGATPVDPDTAPEWVFIAADVMEADTIVEALPPEARVVMLDAAGNGVEAIARALEGQTDVAAVHVVSHGRPGALTLGTAELTTASMAGRHAADLARIGAALGPGGDLLLYGCNFAEGNTGARAVLALARATGADVAASTDTTGAEDGGGDWDLEHAAGHIEARALAADAYGATLAGLSTIVEVSTGEKIRADVLENEWDDGDLSVPVARQTFTLAPGAGSFELRELDLTLYAHETAGARPGDGLRVSVVDGAREVATAFVRASDLPTSYRTTTLALFEPDAFGEPGTERATIHGAREYAILLRSTASGEDPHIHLLYDKKSVYEGGRYSVADDDDDGETNPRADLLFALRGVELGDEPPVALPHAATIREGETLLIPFEDLPVDVGNGGPIVGARIVADPRTANGTVQVSDAGIRFTPTTGFAGTAQFQYFVRNDGESLEPATITITVERADSLPRALDSAVQGPENATISFEATSFGVVDQGDEPLTVRIDGVALRGGILWLADASGDPERVLGAGDTFAMSRVADLRFTPLPDFAETASFTFSVSDGTEVDGSPRWSNEARMAITVLNMDRPPVAADVTLRVEGATPLPLPLSTFARAADADPDGEPVEAVVFLGLAGLPGTLENAAGPIVEGRAYDEVSLATLVWTPPTGHSGIYVFEFALANMPFGTLVVGERATATLHVAEADTATPADDPNDTDPLAEGDGPPNVGDRADEPDIAIVTVDPGAGPQLPLILSGTVEERPEPEEDEPEEDEPEEDEEEESEEEADAAFAPPSTPPAQPLVLSGNVRPASFPAPAPVPAAAGIVAPVVAPVALPEDASPTPSSPPVGLPDRTPFPDFARSTPFATPRIASYTFTPLDPVILTQEIGRAGDEVRRYDEVLGTTAAKVTFAFGSALAVGSVSYLIQSGALAAALLSAMPAWRRYDPIEIVSGRREKSAAGSEAGRDTASDVEKMRRAVAAARARVDAAVAQVATTERGSS